MATVSLAVYEDSGLVEYTNLTAQVTSKTTIKNIVEKLKQVGYLNAMASATIDGKKATAAQKILGDKSSSQPSVEIHGTNAVSPLHRSAVTLLSTTGSIHNVPIPKNITFGTLKSIAAVIHGANQASILLSVTGKIPLDRDVVTDVLAANQGSKRTVVVNFVSPYVVVTFHVFGTCRKCKVSIPRSHTLREGLRSAEPRWKIRPPCANLPISSLITLENPNELVYAYYCDEMAATEEPEKSEGPPTKRANNSDGDGASEATAAACPPVPAPPPWNGWCYIVTHTGKTLHLRLESSYTVEEVKEEIEDSEKIPICQQRLVWCAIQLENSRTLSSYGISVEARLHLELRLRGGMYVEANERVVFDLLGDSGVVDYSPPESGEMVVVEDEPEEEEEDHKDCHKEGGENDCECGGRGLCT